MKKKFNLKNRILEIATSGGAGKAIVDLGGGDFFANQEDYMNVNEDRAKQIGYTVLDYLITHPTTDMIFKNKSTYFPKGEMGNYEQTKEIKKEALEMWKYRIDPIATQAGFYIYTELKEDVINKVLGLKQNSLDRLINGNFTIKTLNNLSISEQVLKNYKKLKQYKLKLNEGMLDSILNYIGKVLSDNKTKEVKKAIADNPELSKAIDDLNAAYANARSIADQMRIDMDLRNAEKLKNKK